MSLKMEKSKTNVTSATKDKKFQSFADNSTEKASISKLTKGQVELNESGTSFNMKKRKNLKMTDSEISAHEASEKMPTRIHIGKVDKELRNTSDFMNPKGSMGVIREMRSPTARSRAESRSDMESNSILETDSEMKSE